MKQKEQLFAYEVGEDEEKKGYLRSFDGDWITLGDHESNSDTTETIHLIDRDRIFAIGSYSLLNLLAPSAPGPDTPFCVCPTCTTNQFTVSSCVDSACRSLCLADTSSQAIYTDGRCMSDTACSCCYDLYESRDWCGCVRCSGYTSESSGCVDSDCVNSCLGISFADGICYVDDFFGPSCSCCNVVGVDLFK
eukprot:TRINITY_DN12353_c0_g1_i1.p1 TRINITY_DN12353_c0_g1~~TRINITY_DN12353_c0_g1_i1.p1  ORF type:complete len:192 (+),score=17.73 TRINITY_DN12353_c0_g1_i1:837-1412(+)